MRGAWPTGSQRGTPSALRRCAERALAGPQAVPAARTNGWSAAPGGFSRLTVSTRKTRRQWSLKSGSVHIKDAGGTSAESLAYHWALARTDNDAHVVFLCLLNPELTERLVPGTALRRQGGPFELDLERESSEMFDQHDDAEAAASLVSVGSRVIVMTMSAMMGTPGPGESRPTL